jgi:hypothetical protein
MKQLILSFMILSLLLLAPVGLMAYDQVSAGGVIFQWQTVGDYLDCALTASTTGWVAVGFNPTDVMQDANVIIGYVSGGVAVMRDDWGTGQNTHAADTSLGGVDNLMGVVGAETAGVTGIHFIIPLDSGDSYDRPLSIGSSYQILLAQGSDDSFTGMHTNAGFATINIVTEVGSENSTAPGLRSALSPVFPNPFNPIAHIGFSVAAGEHARVIVYDVRGREVRDFGEFPAGSHKLVWNGDDESGRQASNGVYIVRMMVGGKAFVQKTLMLK